MVRTLAGDRVALFRIQAFSLGEESDVTDVVVGTRAHAVRETRDREPGGQAEQELEFFLHLQPNLRGSRINVTSAK